MADLDHCFENLWPNGKSKVTAFNMASLTSLDWLERPPMVEEIDNNDEDDQIEPQIWADFDETSERFRRSLYYGRTPNSDRLSLPVTEICVSKFNELNLDEDYIYSKLNRLDVCKAAEITKETCSSPTSLVLALMYLDRLRHNNPKYLGSISSTDLFLVSLMVASKFLHDDGEEDEVFNDEWASSGGMEKKELNKLEMDFLTAIDWNIYVSPTDYEAKTECLELAVAMKEVDKRGGWTTYSDLLVMSKQMDLVKIWEILYEYTVKLTAVCAFAYAASLMTMIGTCHLVSRSTHDHRTQNLLMPRQHDSNQAADSSEEIVNEVDDRVGFAVAGLNSSSNDNECNLMTTAHFFKVDDKHPEETLLRFHQHSFVNRLKPALFALKMGSFRDLMLGSQLISGIGHV